MKKNTIKILLPTFLILFCFLGVATIRVSAQATTGPTYTYQWSDGTGGTGQQVNPGATGTYSVTVTDNNNTTWTGPATQKEPDPSNGQCKITSATFDPYTPDGTISANFYNNDHRPKVVLTINTTGCVTDQPIYVSLAEVSSWAIRFSTNRVGVLNSTEFDVPASGSFKITLISGEEKCTHKLYSTADCNYVITVSPWADLDDYSSSGQQYGQLSYNCSGSNCLGANWAFVSDTADHTKNSTTVSPGNTAFSTGVNDACTGSDGKPKPDCYAVFSGFADALSHKFDSLTTSTSLGAFLNGVIALIVGIGGVITVIMIMIEGVLYMKTDNVNTKTETRSRIVKTLVGFLILLSIYVILRTINPDLLNLTPVIGNVSLNGAAQLTPSQFQNITHEPLKTPSQYDDLVKQIAQQDNSDYCALRTIVSRESNGNAAIIGQDENAPALGIPSRTAFINSGKKYSGATFTPDQNLITNNKFCNDATTSCLGNVPQPDSPSLGLDWRFSKGVGLTQITFFPQGYGSHYTANDANRDVVPSLTLHFSDGSSITTTPTEAIKPEVNLDIAAKLWNTAMAKCNSAEGAFYTYACGACSCGSSPFALQEVPKRMDQYNQCKQQNPT